MIATTIKASMMSPRWPLLRWPQGVKMTIAPMMIAISEKPNQSSLRIFTAAPLPFGAASSQLDFGRHVLVKALDILVLDVHHFLQLVDINIVHVSLSQGSLTMHDKYYA